MNEKQRNCRHGCFTDWREHSSTSRVRECIYCGLRQMRYLPPVVAVVRAMTKEEEELFEE